MPPEACSVNASLIAAYPQSALPSFVYKTPIRVIRITNIRPRTEPTMTVLYLASDLIWATKIKSTAEAIGVEARPVRSIEMLTARLEDTDAAALILDLEAADTALAMLDFLKGPDAPTRHPPSARSPSPRTSNARSSTRPGPGAPTRSSPAAPSTTTSPRSSFAWRPETPEKPPRIQHEEVAHPWNRADGVLMLGPAIARRAGRGCVAIGSRRSTGPQPPQRGRGRSPRHA